MSTNIISISYFINNKAGVKYYYSNIKYINIYIYIYIYVCVCVCMYVCVYTL